MKVMRSSPSRSEEPVPQYRPVRWSQRKRDLQISKVWASSATFQQQFCPIGRHTDETDESSRFVSNTVLVSPLNCRSVWRSISLQHAFDRTERRVIQSLVPADLPQQLNSPGASTELVGRWHGEGQGCVRFRL